MAMLFNKRKRDALQGGGNRLGDGHIGIVTRSAALVPQLAIQLRRFGLAPSLVVVLEEGLPAGLTVPELLMRLDADPVTDAVLLIGPLDAQDEAACLAWLAGHRAKPVVGFIDDTDPAQAQRARWQQAGAHMTRNPSMLGELTASVVDTRWLPFD